jgi:pimeloyl-ACP methyl ester carboxylesterase
MQTVANCGHFAEMEKPAEVAELVTNFINAA